MEQPTESWKPIPEWEGWYEVSDLGRVRSLERTIHTRGGERICKGKILRPGTTLKGYSQVMLQRAGMRSPRSVHRLVLEAFFGPGTDGAEACHRNGVPSDNRLENLRWGSRSSNAQDRVRHGTHNRSTRTVCPRGHRLESPNIIPTHLKRGFRACLACQRARSYARRHPGAFTQELADEYYAAIMA